MINDKENNMFQLTYCFYFILRFFRSLTLLKNFFLFLRNFDILSFFLRWLLHVLGNPVKLVLGKLQSSVGSFNDDGLLIIVFFWWKIHINVHVSLWMTLFLLVLNFRHFLVCLVNCHCGDMIISHWNSLLCWLHHLKSHLLLQLLLDEGLRHLLLLGHLILKQLDVGLLLLNDLSLRCWLLELDFGLRHQLALNFWSWDSRLHRCSLLRNASKSALLILLLG